MRVIASLTILMVVHQKKIHFLTVGIPGRGIGRWLETGVEGGRVLAYITKTVHGRRTDSHLKEVEDMLQNHPGEKFSQLLTDPNPRRESSDTPLSPAVLIPVYPIYDPDI